jgi:exosortase
MKRYWLLFISLCAALAAIGWRPFSDTLKLAFRNDEYTHILLVIPIALALGFMERHRLTGLLKFSALEGAALLALAILIGIAAAVLSGRITADLQLSMQMLGLVIAWIAIFVICFGTAAARAMIFPLSFLFWLVPFPDVLLNRLVGYLQSGSAISAKALFVIAGVPVVLDGRTLLIPGLTIEIAKECSSIRSSLMLLVTTIILAQLLLRSPLRRMLVIALALPLSVAKNGLRIFTITMLGTRVDPAYLHGRLHHSGGIVFFAISLLLVFSALIMLGRGEKRTSGKPALQPVMSG